MSVTEAAAPPVTAGTTVEQAGEVRLARIESLRALAALGVLLGHAWFDGQVKSGHIGSVADTFWHRIPLSGGFGLSLFFALSGYLIFWPFAQRAFGSGGPVDLKVYARNRAYRILPLYYSALVILLIVQEHGGTWHQWWRFALFSENFSTDTAGTVDGPMWTLVVELHFYLLLPLGAFVLERVTRGNRSLGAAIVAAVGLASFALHWHYVADNYGPIDHRKEWSLPLQFGFFSTGMLVAILRTAWRDGLPGWVRGPAARADVWIVATIPLWVIAVHSYKYLALTAVASAMLVGACVLPLRSGPLLRSLDQRWLAIIGVASYSLYIWHSPIILAIDDTFDTFPSVLAAGGALSILAALISYRLIEQPFLRLRKRWSENAAAHTSS